MKEQTVSLIVKINFLILGFGLVIYAIWYLNFRGLPPGAQQLIGLDAAAKVTLCQTRVKALAFGDQGQVFEENMTWKKSPGFEILNQLAMEKWFGKYCTVGATAADNPEGSAPIELLWRFVNGRQQVLEIWPEQQVYRFLGTTFRSPELTAGLAELAQLADLKNPLISGQ